MGEAGKHLLFECVQAGCHVVLRGRRGTLWHSNLFDHVSKISKLEEVLHEMFVLVLPRVSSRVSGFPVASPCLWGKLRTPHSTLYTPHSTIYTLNSTLYTLHSTLYTLHFTLLTPHLRLYTPHSTLYTTLYTFHSSLLTLHFTLHTPHFTLHTPYFTLHTPHFPLHTGLSKWPSWKSNDETKFWVPQTKSNKQMMAISWISFRHTDRTPPINYWVFVSSITKGCFTKMKAWLEWQINWISSRWNSICCSIFVEQIMFYLHPIDIKENSLAWFSFVLGLIEIK